MDNYSGQILHIKEQIEEIKSEVVFLEKMVNLFELFSLFLILVMVIIIFLCLYFSVPMCKHTHNAIEIYKTVPPPKIIHSPPKYYVS